MMMQANTNTVTGPATNVLALRETTGQVQRAPKCHIVFGDPIMYLYYHKDR